VKVRYQFRFYPTAAQAEELSRVFGCCRYVHNRALRLITDSWQERKERVTCDQASTKLTLWKLEEPTKWLADVSSVPLQRSLRHLNSAFVKFFNKEAKYPSFKKKSNRQSAEYSTNAFKYADGTLTVSGLGKLDVRWSREFQSQPTTITITKRPSGRYHVTLVLDETFQPLPKTGQSVGIDLGIIRLATLSTGEHVSNPRHLSKNQAKLTKEQRVLSHRTKGSGRWNRQRVKVAKVHEHITDARKDNLNKVTTDIVRRFDRISMEDLSVRDMVKNHRYSYSLSDATFGLFRSMVEYKCERYEKELWLVNRFFPSSKRCSACGHILSKLAIDTREWTCPKCGTEHDRDLNAARNIHSAGGQLVQARGDRARRFKPSGLKRTSRGSVNQTA